MNKIHYTSLFSEEALQDALDRKLVNKRKHPTLDLWIYNYGALTQYSWEWSDVTINCRGLVLDSEGYIIARSLPKFFSYEQLEGKLPEGKYVVEEKMDGSMLLAFNYKGELVTATRGSFESEQAKGAKRFIKNFLPVKGITYVFEYISNENKIVVNYDCEGLVLLAMVNLEGEEADAEWLDVQTKFTFLDGHSFRRPKIYNFNDLEEILNFHEDNIEGFVLRYESGERVKVKTEDYKRLHKLLIGFNEKDVWEALKENKLEEVLEEVPDEMYDFVKSVQKDLEEKYSKIYSTAVEEFVDLGNRKDNAIHYTTKCKYSGLLFNLLDGKDISEAIWKMVKPKVTQTFKIVNEESN